MHVAIIGNGIAGGVLPAGCASSTMTFASRQSLAETEFQFLRTALMYAYIATCAGKTLMLPRAVLLGENRIKLEKNYVERVYAAGNKLEFADGMMLYDHL
jgi:hypothetical protein